MKTKAIALFLVAFCACTSLAVQAETIEEVLEKSVPYSAMLSVSPESGDLIFFIAQNLFYAGREESQIKFLALFFLLT